MSLHHLSAPDCCASVESEARWAASFLTEDVLPIAKAACRCVYLDKRQKTKIGIHSRQVAGFLLFTFLHWMCNFVFAFWHWLSILLIDFWRIKCGKPAGSVLTALPGSFPCLSSRGPFLVSTRHGCDSPHSSCCFGSFSGKKNIS